MVDYTIAAISTRYRGRLYRSRLEARWAAFFDILGWRHEYEPFDLGAWSPDFLLHGAMQQILCEIKPVSALDAEVATRVSRAANTAGFTGEILLLGVDPFCLGQEEWLGWLDDGSENEDGIRHFGVFDPCWPVSAPDGRFDFCHSVASYHGRMTGAWDGDHYVVGEGAFPTLRRLWSEASNAVQWRGRDAQS